MNRRIFRQSTQWAVTCFMFLGCSSTFVTSPSSQSPQSLDAIIANTAAAAQTQTASFFTTIPSSKPTYTPEATETNTMSPSPTETYAVVTETLVPGGFLEEGGYDYQEATAYGSRKSSNSSPGKLTNQLWNCGIISQTPSLGAEFEPGTTFTATWVIWNNGTETWPKKSVDVVHYSGAYIQTGRKYMDIPAAVAPRSKISISIEFQSPNRPETYSAHWSLKNGNTYFCSMKIFIVVK